jgi:hypothetical protein
MTGIMGHGRASQPSRHRRMPRQEIHPEEGEGGGEGPATTARQRRSLEEDGLSAPFHSEDVRGRKTQGAGTCRPAAVSETETTPSCFIVFRAGKQGDVFSDQIRDASREA